MLLLLAALVSFASVAVTMLHAAPAIKPVSYWEGQLLAYAWEKDPNRCFEMSKKPDTGSGRGGGLYHLGGCVDGYTAMYEATGKTQYLDRAIELTNNVMAATVCEGGTGPDCAGGYRVWRFASLDVGHGWRNMARLAYVLRTDPALYQQPKYRAAYDKIITFTDHDVFQMYYLAQQRDRDFTKVFYRSRTHIASHWAMIAQVLWLIHDNPPWKERYREVFTKINENLRPERPSSLREQLQRHPLYPDALVFHDDWTLRYGQGYGEGRVIVNACPGGLDPEGCHLVSDTHHANDTIGYMVFGAERGMYWTKGDMQGLANMVKRLTWNGSYDNVKYANYLDGTGGFEDAGAQCVDEGILKLGRFDPELQRVFENDFPHGCNFPNFFGQMALNAKLLLDPAAAPTPTTAGTAVTATVPASTPTVTPTAPAGPTPTPTLNLCPTTGAIVGATVPPQTTGPQTNAALRRALVVAVTASSCDGGYVPANTIDGNLDIQSRWSALGVGQWIQFDLGESCTLAELRIAFFVGDQRHAYFIVQSSENGETWTVIPQLFSSSGTTTELESFALPPIRGRYVRIVGYGNDSALGGINTQWNSYTEVELYAQ